MTLMTSWAVVCDVYFLEPQSKKAGENAQEFAERVQQLIARKANLRVAPWDGYLKYYNLGKKVVHHSLHGLNCMIDRPHFLVSQLLALYAPRISDHTHPKLPSRFDLLIALLTKLLLQHPDLIEKRRRLFSDKIRRYIEGVSHTFASIILPGASLTALQFSMSIAGTVC